jgi:arginine deiminase
MAASKVTQGHQQLEEALKRERDKVKVLEEQLEERQDGASAFKKLQKKYNTIAETYTDVVELCL